MPRHSTEMMNGKQVAQGLAQSTRSYIHNSVLLEESKRASWGLEGAGGQGLREWSIGTYQSIQRL